MIDSSEEIVPVAEDDEAENERLKKARRHASSRERVKKWKATNSERAKALSKKSYKKSRDADPERMKARFRTNVRARYAKKKAGGLCRYCPAIAVRGGRCDHHAAREAARKRSARAKKKAEAGK